MQPAASDRRAPLASDRRTPLAYNRRVLLLDAMGTLVRLEPPAPALRSELVDRFGVGVSLAQAQRAVAAEIGYYRAHLQDGRDAEGVRALRAGCAETLRAALVREAPPEADRLRGLPGADLVEALMASLRFSAYEDAPAALVAARRRGERTIVVSNWDVTLSEALERVGLAPLLHGVVTSAGAGVRKPDPAIFARALAIAGATPELSRHVGDSLEEDVAGARAAGIAVTWLSRTGAPGPPGVRTITTLADLGAPS